MKTPFMYALVMVFAFACGTKKATDALESSTVTTSTGQEMALVKASDEAQEITVSGKNDKISGSKIIVPPNVVERDTPILIEEAASIADEVANNFSIKMDATGTAVAIQSPSSDAEFKKAFTLRIPLPNKEKTAQDKLIVMYKIKRPSEDKFVIGMISHENLSIKGKHFDFSFQYFGIFQSAYLSETSAPAVTSEVQAVKPVIPPIVPTPTPTTNSETTASTETTTETATTSSTETTSGTVEETPSAPPVVVDPVKWTTGNLSLARVYFATATVGNKVFFAGGYGIGASDCVDIYDATTGAWTTATLSQPRYHLAATSIGTKVFFAGGRTDANAYSNRIDIYDTATDIWSTATLSQGRSELTAVTVGTMAIFAGGQNVSLPPYVTDRVDMYDSTTNTWTTGSLSRARKNLASTSNESKAIFAGGAYYENGSYTSLATMDIYDLATKTWSASNLSQARSNLAAASGIGYALFAGGDYVQGGDRSNRIDIINYESLAMTSATLSQARSHLAAASIGSKIVFAGGANEDYPYKSTKVDVYDVSTGSMITSEISVGRFSIIGIGINGKAMFAGGISASLSSVVDICEIP